MTGACCAHLKVIYDPEILEDGRYVDRWLCDLCRSRFMPESLHLHLIHNVEQERDALLGKPDAVHQGALAAIECMKQFEALKAERDELQRKLDVFLKHSRHKTGTVLDFESEIAYIDELQNLAAPAREGEGGTE